MISLIHNNHSQPIQFQNSDPFKTPLFENLKSPFKQLTLFKLSELIQDIKLYKGPCHQAHSKEWPTVLHCKKCHGCNVGACPYNMLMW